jgi:hypothetical protein
MAAHMGWSRSTTCPLGNDSIMLSFLNRKCQCGHDHAGCRGRDCKASEDYTSAVIDAIHSGFRLCCGPSDETFVGKCTDNTLRIVEMGLPGVESFNVFFGGTTSSSMTTTNSTSVSKLPRITLGYSRSTFTPLSDIATATHDSIAGIANHAPSPSMSCGYISDLRSGNIAKDVEVTASLSLSVAVEDDGDHAGISDDLSCVGGGSGLVGVQYPEELYECVEDHYPDEDYLVRGVGYMNYNDESHADGYIYYYRRFASRANDDETTSNLGARDDVAADIDCLRANDGDPPSSLGAHNDVVAKIDCLNHRSGNVRRNYVEI